MDRLVVRGVAMALAGSLAGAACATSPLPFRTADGFRIHADLHRPGGNESAPLVVLAHDLGADRTAWEPLVPHVLELGLATVAMDLRGFGESVEEAASPAELDEIARQNLHLDLAGAIDAAGRAGGVDTSRVAIVAAGLSVNPAVRVAMERPSVRSLILISGLIMASEEEFLIERSDLAVLLVASASDRRGRVLMEQYARRLTGPDQVYAEIEADTKWRGTDGLRSDTTLIEHILWFLTRTFVLSEDSVRD